MLASARVVVMENFQEGPFSLYNRMVQIQLGASRSPSKYLAIHDDRVVVANVSEDLLYISADYSSYGPR